MIIHFITLQGHHIHECVRWGWHCRHLHFGKITSVIKPGGPLKM